MFDELSAETKFTDKADTKGPQIKALVDALTNTEKPSSKILKQRSMNSRSLPTRSWQVMNARSWILALEKAINAVDASEESKGIKKGAIDTITQPESILIFASCPFIVFMF